MKATAMDEMVERVAWAICRAEVARAICRGERSDFKLEPALYLDYIPHAEAAIAAVQEQLREDIAKHGPAKATGP